MACRFQIPLAIALAISITRPGSRGTLDANQATHSAQGAYRKLEQKLLTAKTVGFRFETQVGEDESERVAGSVLLDHQGRARVEFVTSTRSMLGRGRTILVSDGARMTICRPDRKELYSMATPAGFSRAIREAITREESGWGLNELCYCLLPGTEDDPSTRLKRVLGYELSEFKHLPTERVGLTELTVIDYAVRDPRSHDPPTKVSLWINVATGLPQKRRSLRGTITNGLRHTTTVTENYSDFAIDAQCNPSEFDLNK